MAICGGRTPDQGRRPLCQASTSTICGGCKRAGVLLMCLTRQKARVPFTPPPFFEARRTCVMNTLKANKLTHPLSERLAEH